MVDGFWSVGGSERDGGGSGGGGVVRFVNFFVGNGISTIDGNGDGFGKFERKNATGCRGSRRTRIL